MVVGSQDGDRRQVWSRVVGAWLGLVLGCAAAAAQTPRSYSPAVDEVLAAVQGELQNQRPVSAEIRLRAALKQHPKEGRLHIALAGVRWRLGDTEEWESELRSAIDCGGSVAAEAQRRLAAGETILSERGATSPTERPIATARGTGDADVTKEGVDPDRLWHGYRYVPGRYGAKWLTLSALWALGCGWLFGVLLDWRRVAMSNAVLGLLIATGLASFLLPLAGGAVTSWGGLRGLRLWGHALDAAYTVAGRRTSDFLEFVLSALLAVAVAALFVLVLWEWASAHSDAFTLTETERNEYLVLLAVVGSPTLAARILLFAFGRYLPSVVLPSGLLLLWILTAVVLVVHALSGARHRVLHLTDVRRAAGWRAGASAAALLALIFLLSVVPWLRDGTGLWFRWLFGHFA